MSSKHALPSRIIGAVSGLAVVMGVGLFGAMLGGLYVRVFVPRSDMGWDQIADALGGLMLGGLIGLVSGLLIAVRASPRARSVIGALALLGAFAVVLGLRLLAGPPPLAGGASPAAPPARKSFSPMYMVNLRVAHTEPVLRAVATDARPIPFTDVELFSATPHIDRVGWGPDFDHCKVEPDRAELRQLLPLIEDAHSELEAGSCRTPAPDDLSIPIRINLGGERRSGTIESDCLVKRPAVIALAKAIGTLADRLCCAALRKACLARDPQ